MHRDSLREQNVIPSRKSRCEERHRLMEDFLGAVCDLLALHEKRLQAIINKDSEWGFDPLIHVADEKSDRAKYAYLRHVQEHGCSKKR